MITQKYLKECFSYDPSNGHLIWLHDRPSVHFKNDISRKKWQGKNAGKVAGCISSNGYVVITLSGKLLKAHRIAWFYTKGNWPDGQIDHINGIKTDNRICNLRSVNHIENARNQKISSKNTSGCSGVVWNKNKGLWMAAIYDGSKRVHLGYFDDKKSAIQARKEAEVSFGYHENHGRTS
jgi:hypothetical protein